MSKKNTRHTGTTKEQAAGSYLASLGYEILTFNYRCRLAEIDIIAKDHDVIVFCEVKYRKNAGVSSALEAVDFTKQRKISFAALHYLSHNHLEKNSTRFDVIGMSDGKMEHIKNAFDFQL